MILLPLLAFTIGDDGGEIAGAMEVNVPIDLLAIELSKVRSVLLRDMRVTIELSDNRAILSFNQSIIVAVPGPRFGEFNVQFLQQLSNSVIDILTATIGVKAL